MGLKMKLAIIGCLICVGISATAEEVRAQQPRMVTLKWQIHLDDKRDFSFTKLRATVFHSLDRNRRDESSGSIIPDESGRFSFAVPAGSQGSLSLTTSDPTVMNAIAPEEHTDYSWQPGQWELIVSSDFEVPDDSPPIIERKIELRRGAAFSPCIPPRLKRGFVFYWRLPGSRNEKRNVTAFVDASVMKDEVFGGLEPGRWYVKYEDREGHKLSAETLDLRIGEFLRRKCR